MKKIPHVDVDQNYLKQMLETLKQSTNFDDWISGLKKISGRKGAELFHPIRDVLTGQNNGPELRKIFDFLGIDKVKERIESNIK